MKKVFLLNLLALVAVFAVAQYPSRVYLCGPAGPGWATEQWPMYTNVAEDGVTPNGTYEWIGDLSDGDLKFLHGSSWEPGYAPTVNGEALSVGTHTIIDRPTGEDPDDKFAVTAGRYKLEINLTGESFVLTVSDGTGLVSKDGSEQTFKAEVPACVYPIGDATQYGWSPSSSEPIAKAEGADIFDGVVFLKNGEFKLLHQPDWGAQYGPVEGGEGISGAGTYTLCKPSDDNKWIISGIDELTAFHMIADIEAGTLVLRDTSVVIPPCTVLYMCGDAVGGWSFDDNSIELTSEDSVFTYEGPLFDGEFKFFEKKDFGSQAWGATVAGTPVTGSGEFDLVKLSEDNKFYMTAGYYKLTANLKTGKMSVVYSVTALENTEATKAQKFVENGQVVIIRNGEKYSVLGQKL